MDTSRALGISLPEADEKAFSANKEGDKNKMRKYPLPIAFENDVLELEILPQRYPELAHLDEVAVCRQISEMCMKHDKIIKIFEHADEKILGREEKEELLARMRARLAFMAKFPDCQQLRPQITGPEELEDLSLIDGHTCCHWQRSGMPDVVVMFGGHVQNGGERLATDTIRFMVLSNHELVMHKVSPSSRSRIKPKARYSHTAVICERFMFVFGGSGGESDKEILNDLHVFDCEKEGLYQACVSYYKHPLNSHF